MSRGLSRGLRVLGVLLAAHRVASSKTRRDVGNHLIKLAHRIEPKLETELRAYIQQVGHQCYQAGRADGSIEQRAAILAGMN